MNRLETIASLIRPCKVFADIGCDHGYISLFVARSALAEKIIATDISALSLDKARRVMADYPTVLLPSKKRVIPSTRRL